MLRVVVVDDEPAARERLSRMLLACDGVEVCGEAPDGLLALELIRKVQPAAAFLDIEMPGCSGLEVASSLPSGNPRIVFCTAYDQYALEAFDVRAVDYLLKPVQRPRLLETIQRLRDPQPLAPALPAPAQFLARRGERYVAIPASDVLAFVSENGLTKLWASQEYLVDVTLNDLERRLPETEWCRASRAALLHLPQVAEIHPMPGGGGDAVLRDGRKIEVSRRKLPVLLTNLGRL